MLYPGLFPGWFLLVLGIWIQITFKFKFYRIKLLQKYFSRKIQMQAQWWHIMFLTPSHLGWSKTVLKLWKKLYFWNWNILPKIVNDISYQSWCLHLVPITLSQREWNWGYNPISSYWISLKLSNCSWCIYCPNLVASGRLGVEMAILIICHANVFEKTEYSVFIRSIDQIREIRNVTFRVLRERHVKYFKSKLATRNFWASFNISIDLWS